MEKTMYGSDVAAMYLWGHDAVVSTCMQGGSSGGNQRVFTPILYPRALW
jgi:hypothetical protein